MTMKHGGLPARLGLAGTVLLCAPCVGSALAQDDGICRTVAGETARSACVEAVRTARAAQAAPAPASVRLVVGPVARAPVEAVTGSDLAVAPDRYVGRALLVRGVSCRYADVNRYLCTVSGTPRIEIDTSVVLPPPAQVAIEAGVGCGKTGGMRGRPSCGASLRFIATSARRGGDGTVRFTTPSIVIGR